MQCAGSGGEREPGTRGPLLEQPKESSGVEAGVEAVLRVIAHEPQQLQGDLGLGALGLITRALSLASSYFPTSTL